MALEGLNVKVTFGDYSTNATVIDGDVQGLSGPMVLVEYDSGLVTKVKAEAVTCARCAVRNIQRTQCGGCRAMISRRRTGKGWVT